MTHGTGDESRERFPKRKIGVEIEFAGVSAADAAECVAAHFSGRVVRNHDYEFLVETDAGTFRVELDSRTLKKLAEEAEEHPNRFALSILGHEVLKSAAEAVVPVEVVTPPLHESAMGTLDALVDGLRELGAQGTRDGVFFAFGVHFNPELTNLSAESVLAFLRSFSLLRPWIRDRFDIDLSRRMTRFIQPHRAEYVELILREPYRPSFDALIDDYLAHHPSRNFDLDMLPLFAHVDEPRVRAAVGEDEKINSRPTFHYRLPNADVGSAAWRVSGEWASWRAVERLAQDGDLLQRLSSDFRQFDVEARSMNDESWISHVEKAIT